MMIRDIERTLLPRSRAARDVHPLRKTAEGLGEFLDRLSEAVRDADSVESDIQAHRRGHSRGFKFPAPVGGEGAPAVDLGLTDEEAEALDALREARALAADATNAVMPVSEREVSQERLRELFTDLSAKRVNILSDMLDGKTLDAESGGDPLFSLLTPESSRAAYRGIDGMIMAFLNAGRQNGADGADGAGAPYLDHGAALSASEQLRDFLLAEGPARAFSRFREVNRSNVLGLLQ